ncbi:MAG: alpha/beta hydrolase [Cyclobacteriaceae bacterium]
MKKLAILIGVLTAIIGFTSCSSEWLDEGDHFFLENDGAVMPVWVHGNLSSDVVIIVTHGGPGATSGYEFPMSLGFQELQKDYMMVYWDQRMSGTSQGDPDISKLTIEQHVEDQAKLVELIRHKYNPKSLFLAGHSWGGVLTGKYLGSENHQELFNGWIDIDGSIQDDFEQVAKKEWIMDRIDTVMAKSDSPEFWQYIIDWYEENPDPVENDWQPYLYVGSLGGYAYDWEHTQATNPTPYKDLIFSSPMTLAFYFSQYVDITWMNDYDATEEVSNIEIPSLLLWGAQDGAVPATTAQFTYDHLATPDVDKQIILIDECAHSPYYDKPYEFAAVVQDFVETYK